MLFIAGNCFVTHSSAYVIIMWQIPMCEFHRSNNEAFCLIVVHVSISWSMAIPQCC